MSQKSRPKTLALAKMIKSNKYTKVVTNMYFHRMHSCLAYFYIFAHNTKGGGHPLSKNPLQRCGVALDILAPLEQRP